MTTGCNPDVTPHPYRLRTKHNPERIDGSKVPRGWRFLYAEEAGERQRKPCRMWDCTLNKFSEEMNYIGNSLSCTYIVPIDS